MKKFTLGLVALSFLSLPAFAQSFLKCDFKIADNAVDCPFLGRCPQKVLRESKMNLSFELAEGQLIEGAIPFQKVVLLDKKDKEKDDLITLFGSDDKAQKLKEEKNVKLISYNLNKDLKYSIKKEGNTIFVDFGIHNFWLKGSYAYSGWLLTSHNAITFSCESMTHEVYQEFKAKKEALEQYHEEKQSSQSASRQ
ncbi:MAG: hypothetical protein ACLGHN_13730 [Bacteriovoracia bacterium]